MGTYFREEEVLRLGTSWVWCQSPLLLLLDLPSQGQISPFSLLMFQVPPVQMQSSIQLQKCIDKWLCHRDQLTSCWLTKNNTDLILSETFILNASNKLQSCQLLWAKCCHIDMVICCIPIEKHNLRFPVLIHSSTNSINFLPSSDGSIADYYSIYMLFANTHL